MVWGNTTPNRRLANCKARAVMKISQLSPDWVIDIVVSQPTVQLQPLSVRRGAATSTFLGGTVHVHSGMPSVMASIGESGGGGPHGTRPVPFSNAPIAPPAGDSGVCSAVNDGLLAYLLPRPARLVDVVLHSTICSERTS